MRITKSLPILLISIAVLFSACVDKHKVTRMMNVPVYKSKAELRSMSGVEGAREISHPGKIFFKDNNLFLTEIGEGVHIIDNSDPANPVNQSFIAVPGAIDVQMKNEFLYVDSYTDLVVVDLSDMNNVQFVDRMEDVFIYNLPVHNSAYPRAEIDESAGVVVGWTQEMLTEEHNEYDMSNIWGEGVMAFGDNNEVADAGFVNTSFEGSTKAAGNSFGKAGSMSRFMVKGNHLYVLDAWKLITINISQAGTPSLSSEVVTPYFSETIFPIRNHLVLGTQNGIVFYNLDNMDEPRYVSEYQHVTSCDPVYVNGDYAYVTLRSGNSCWGWVNELHIVNIEDINNPFLVNQYQMNSPRGLSVDEGKLFLCDGSAGLKIYDIENNEQISISNHYSSFQANDVITYGDVLMMIGENGLVQYDYSDINNIHQISVISTNN